MAAHMSSACAAICFYIGPYAVCWRSIESDTTCTGDDVRSKTHDLPLEEMARQLGTSYSSFRRTFREHTVLATSIPMHLKLRHARDLLLKTELSIRKSRFKVDLKRSNTSAASSRTQWVGRQAAIESSNTPACTSSPGDLLPFANKRARIQRVAVKPTFRAWPYDDQRRWHNGAQFPARSISQESRERQWKSIPAVGIAISSMDGHRLASAATTFSAPSPFPR